VFVVSVMSLAGEAALTGVARPEQPAEPARVVVLALGNPLRGDDGVGLAVMDALETSPALPTNVILISDGTGRQLRALRARETGRLIVIDAVEMGLAPGMWRRFTLADVRPSSDVGLLSHKPGLLDVLAFSSEPANTIIYGIQPASTAYALELSREVRAVVQEVCATIEEEIRFSAAPTSEYPVALPGIRPQGGSGNRSGKK
jgi:hydrogenase maturation protease